MWLAKNSTAHHCSLCTEIFVAFSSIFVDLGKMARELGGSAIPCVRPKLHRVRAPPSTRAFDRWLLVLWLSSRPSRKLQAYATAHKTTPSCKAEPFLLRFPKFKILWASAAVALRHNNTVQDNSDIKHARVHMMPLVISSKCAP